MYWLIYLKTTARIDFRHRDAVIKTTTLRSGLANFLLGSAVLCVLALSSDKLAFCGQKVAITVPGFLVFKLQFQLDTARIAFPQISEVSTCFFGFAWVVCAWETHTPTLTVDM